ncbi:MAG: hypothetical protein H7255_06510, partial [Ramlibacter sp.]|nr:hypothetical protein [Ramlibacter sp.]
YDPGHDGGFYFGEPWDYVHEDWSRTNDEYVGNNWAGNFSVVESPADRDVITAGLTGDIVKGVIGGLATDGVKVYWNWLIKDGSPVPEGNGVNWQLSPFFTQGA